MINRLQLFLLAFAWLAILPSLFAQNPPEPVSVTMGNLVGINIQPSDPYGRWFPFATLREFHSWSTDIGFDNNTTASALTSEHNYRFSPTKDNNSIYSLDQRYASGQRRIFPVLIDVAPQFIGATNFDNNKRQLKPIAPSTNNATLGSFPNTQAETASGFAYLYPSNISNTGIQINPAWYNIGTSNHQSKPKLFLDHSKWMSHFALRYGNAPFNTPNDATFKNVMQESIFPFQSDPLLNVAQTAAILGFDDFNVLKTGQNTLKYIEISNEPDKFWRDAQSLVWNAPEGDLDYGKTWYQMKPTQMAAQLSADYDGHGCNVDFKVPTTTSQYYGVKNISPNVQVVMGGLYDLHGAYIEKMAKWSQNNRSLLTCNGTAVPILPFDVINFHRYSTVNNPGYIESDFDANLYNVYGTGTPIPAGVLVQQGISPEADELKKKLDRTLERLFDSSAFLHKEIGGSSGLTTLNTAVRNELKAKEIWMSEFGYDTHPNNAIVPNDNSATTNIPFNNADGTLLSYGKRLDIQGQWLVRSYLAISAVKHLNVKNKITKAHTYKLKDVAAKSNTLAPTFDHSGLLFSDNSPKPAYFQVLTLKNTLNDYIFDAEVAAIVRNASGTALSATTYKVYRYKHKDNIAVPMDPTNQTVMPNGNRYTYVVWSTAFNGLVINNCTLEITDVLYNKYSSAGSGSKFTRINNRDMDINGFKTAMTLTNINRISTFTLSEQPVFIYVGHGSTAATLTPDTEPANILNLTFKDLCCGSVRLAWAIQSNENTKYQVYFVKKSDFIAKNGHFGLGDPTNTFNLLADATLANENVIYNTCVVSHPDLVVGETYYFFVVPIKTTGNVVATYESVLNFCSNAKPVPIGVAAPGLQLGSAPNNGGIPSVTIPISATQVAAVNNSSSNIETYQKIFSTVPYTNYGLCVTNPTNIDLNAGDFPYVSWSSTFANPANTGQVENINEVVVSLSPNGTSGFVLDNIRLLDGQGGGRIRIDLLVCQGGQNTWISYKTVTMSSSTRTWISLSDNLYFKQVVKVRFRMLDSQGSLLAVRFCGFPTTCVPPLYCAPVPNAITTVEVQHITNQSALLSLDKVKEHYAFPESDLVSDYQLVLGTDTIKGVLSQGDTVIVQGQDAASTLYYPLDNLSPGTTYYGTLMPKPVAVFCPVTLDSLPIKPFKFTTSGIQPTQPLLWKATPKPLLVYPNPTSDYLFFECPALGYQQARILNAAGNTILSRPLNPDEVNGSLDLTALPDGWYILKVSKTDGTFLTEQVLLRRQ